MTSKLLDDCFAHDKRRLRHGEALAILKQRVEPVAARETVPLAEAAGRILAEPAVAPRPVPAHTNAAVDGYAFAAADYDAAGGAELPGGGTGRSGPRLVGAPVLRTAARIFTGAAMPAGHDTVVMQEDVEAKTVAGQIFVSIPPGLKRGANVRRAGEDVEAGRDPAARRRGAASAGAGRAGLDRHGRGGAASPVSGWRSSRPATRWCAPARRSRRARSTMPTRRC